MPDDDIITKRHKQAIVLSVTLKAILWTAGIIGFALLVTNALVGLTSRGQLYDCTTAGGQCYNDSINRANARTELTKDVIVLTAVCAEEPTVRTETDRITRIRLIERCVNEQLEKEGEAP